VRTVSLPSKESMRAWRSPLAPLLAQLRDGLARMAPARIATARRSLPPGVSIDVDSLIVFAFSPLVGT
jgi:hypothetical protein